ncbi:ABC transporter substrate-binding protein [Propionimicrobium sp. BV2F7]|uniref:ABC transporter substrate-binding protein n=1 Tax=Propionimicrobium TaxID=203133 RepID=UPI0003D79D9A|nr:sugar ABC transporter substrate-binding protein [Propionimicrobium sp. BV2F7]ETJ98228.1 ABC transporter, solute-binding protein [Propionimicrobium sp. BV2F7]
MSRKKNFRLASGALAAVLCLSMTGCGSAKESDVKTLDVMMSPHALTDHIQNNLSEFEQENDVKVNITSLNEDQVSQQLRVELGAANSKTDVFLFRPPQDSAQFVNNGWIQSLDDKVSEEGFDWEDFGPAAREAVTSREGNVVAVPVATARQMLFYRKDLLDANGISVPTNLDELKSAAAKLKTGDMAGICMRGQKAQAVTTWAQFLYQFDGDWNEGAEPYGDARLNSKEAVEAFKYYGDLLRESGPDGVLNMSWAECSALFQQGKVAMLIEGDDRWPEFTDPAKSTLTAEQVGYAKSPAHTSSVTPQALAISAFSDNPDIAWKFVKWATSKEMAAKMQSVGVMGARDSAWEAPETKEFFPDAVIEAVRFGNAEGVPYDRPRIVKVGEARDAIGEVIVSAIEGKDVEASAETANKSFQALIDAEKQEFGIK